MISKALHIQQPYSGEYTEKIYDIESCWNSSEWSWIRFENDNEIWCGEFRGKFRGVALSEKLQITVVLTSDYMYVLDSNTAEVIDYLSQPQYLDITITPLQDILITDSYGIEILKGNKLASIESIVMPIQVEDLQFEEYVGNCLRMTCYEFLAWDKRVELYLDCNSFKWVDG